MDKGLSYTQNSRPPKNLHTANDVQVPGPLGHGPQWILSESEFSQLGWPNPDNIPVLNRLEQVG
jgi:hypothetical protein